jgi:LysM repeat protein
MSLVRGTAALVTLAAVLVLPDVALGSSQQMPSPSVAALQVALQAQGLYPARVDGVDGPLTRSGLASFRQRAGINGHLRVDRATRKALGALGRPLLGQRELSLGAVGWDVSSLEFRLRPFGLPLGKIDGRFDAATSRALRKFQRAKGLTADGIAGLRTFEAIARDIGTSRPAGATTPKSATQPSPAIHVVAPGDSFFSIAARYRVSPLQLASVNRLKLGAVIVPNQRLVLPRGAQRAATAVPTQTAQTPVSRDAVRASIDRWSAVYGVDPKLARAVAWMESGFQQHVVSHVGAIGVMQLLPETWEWADTLIGERTSRTYDGNVRAGVRVLRWLLDDFKGNVRLALAGYYQGARAVRERGLFDDTKQYVGVVLKLYGSV